MIDYDRIFEQHTYLSRICNGGFIFLDEAKYKVPNIVNLFSSLKDAVNEKIDWNKISNGTTYSLTFNEKIFNFQTFFKKILIKLNVTFVTNIEKPTYRSYIDTDNEKVDIHFEQVEELVLKIEIKSSEYAFIPMLASAFYHEMLHAYEDFQRKLKNDDYNSLNKYNLLSGYLGLEQISKLQINHIDALVYILYHLHQTEQRAFISGGLGELDLLCQNSGDTFFPNAIGLIRKTRSYQNIEMLYDKIDELMEIHDKENQDALLKVFNSRKILVNKQDKKSIKDYISNFIFQNSPSKLQYYNFTTYNQLVKFLYYKVQNVYDDFVNAMMKEADMIQSIKYNRTYSTLQ